ncbi:MAG: WecB/TagA/CpsF family glycosyltransferase [Lentisphaerae bacterium]|jgi:N-acetylglucosaminyldiphosphoundecaprenol N-acetyl-beta-D-mannosaminyltransferase|nr:WecB/TagA/CpsF family glycosyltransferase [Lentisphaerota bacterium]MBT7056227.1 WecB/TagA/CpsF family glycosyltransferase [Lentisphaerota bacterium]MBT7841851.1 WecB/TagA/CpsF family glycosyltransferase [Lentisphaerota bacterium]
MEATKSLVLGIPLDNLDMNETLDRLFELADSWAGSEQPAHLIATINVDFLVNCLPFGRGPFKHPELVSILRKATMCTADGMPLVWASRLLGCPYKERVTGADMVPAIAERAARTGHSLYLLGGALDVAQEAADVLCERHPGLTIAGVDSPFVHTGGEKLVDAPETDGPICERINASGAHFLMIGFGNPKQEIWFQRNQHRLRVPLSFGIGGTFNFITGRTPRAPQWMQTAGVEWLYRLAAEPRRLWKRYFIGLTKFGSAVLPGIVRYQMLRLRAPAAAPPLDDALYIAGERVLRELRLPAVLAPTDVPALHAPFHSDPRPDAVVLDCAQLQLLSASCQGILYDLLRLSEQEQVPVYLVGLRKALVALLHSCRIHDAFEDRLCRSHTNVMSRLADCWKVRPCLFSVETSDEELTLRVWGELNAAALNHVDAEAAVAALAEKPCSVDLRACTSVDNAGVALLLKLRRRQAQHDKPLAIRNARSDVLRVLRTSDAEEQFAIQ